MISCKKSDEKFCGTAVQQALSRYTGIHHLFTVVKTLMFSFLLCTIFFGNFTERIAHSAAEINSLGGALWNLSIRFLRAIQAFSSFHLSIVHTLFLGFSPNFCLIIFAFEFLGYINMIMTDLILQR